MAGDQSSRKTKILFICLGNICRSPMAACVFRDLAKQRDVGDKWCVHSAALGPWHVGGSGDTRMLMTLKKHKVPAEHRVRQIRKGDFDEFDLILGMDTDNMKELKRLAPADSKAKLVLFGDYDPKGETIIRDPYYDSDLVGFEKVYEQCVRCSNGLLDHDHV